jgi:hypothetical protein
MHTAPSLDFISPTNGEITLDEGDEMPDQQDLGAIEDIDQTISFQITGSSEAQVESLSAELHHVLNGWTLSNTGWAHSYTTKWMPKPVDNIYLKIGSFRVHFWRALSS